MAVKYSVIQRKNPLKPKDTPKFYAQVQSSGEENFKSMASAVADRCTVTASDAKGVLDAFMTVMLQRLQNGQIVRINDLGSFRMSATSKGAETEEDFKAGGITKARIIFTPCKDLKDMCKVISFTKTAATVQNEDEDHGEDPTV
jgi:putative DNA-binding protein